MGLIQVSLLNLWATCVFYADAIILGPRHRYPTCCTLEFLYFNVCLSVMYSLQIILKVLWIDNSGADAVL